jgi:hypothetical protein
MEKYILSSGYVLSEDNKKDITSKIPNSILISVGTREEIQEKIRLRGEFKYTLQSSYQLTLEQLAFLKEMNLTIN